MFWMALKRILRYLNGTVLLILVLNIRGERRILHVSATLMQTGEGALKTENLRLVMCFNSVGKRYGNMEE